MQHRLRVGAIMLHRGGHGAVKVHRYCQNASSWSASLCKYRPNTPIIGIPALVEQLGAVIVQRSRHVPRRDSESYKLKYSRAGSDL